MAASYLPPATEWTVKAMGSAVASLTDLVRTKTKAYNAKLNVQVVFDPIVLPVSGTYCLPPGATVKDQNDVVARSAFAAHQHYGE